MKKLIVNVSPHIHGRDTTRTIMLDVIIALMPALVASCIIFGLRSLLLTVLSAAFCVLLEYVWCRSMKKDVTIGDLSAVVTGILLAFNVPSTLPIWQLLVGDIIAIIVVKMLFGGLGCNFVNPALAGRVMLMFSFPATMTSYNPGVAAVDALTTATPLAVLDKLDWSHAMTLLLGQHGGVLGETCAIALIAGGIYLLARKVIRIWIPLTYIGSTLLFSWLFGSPAPVLSLISGGLMLGAFFMATDYVTSPITDWGKVIFGIGCGLLTSAMRVFANAAEAVSLAILLMNLLVPYINDWTRPRAFGEVRAK